MGSQGIADVLRGIIGGVPAVATLLMVLTAVFGMFLTGYGMTRLYQANVNPDGTATHWFVAVLIGGAMTCSLVVIGQLSFFYTG